MDQHRGLEAEAVQHQLGLVADAPQARGDVFPVAQGCAQLGIGHGRDDGIGIGVAVACDIDGFHGVTSCVGYIHYNTFFGDGEEGEGEYCAFAGGNLQHRDCPFQTPKFDSIMRKTQQ